MRRTGLRLSFFLLFAAACGSRTGLFTDERTIDAGTDAGGIVDGGRRDGARDGAPPPDALPPIDARPPQDVVRTDCPDADATLVYVITDDEHLYSLEPTTGVFKQIGKIACPSTSTPFSMAVDRRGVAYILFRDERLYRVSTLTAACVATSYVPRQSNFGLFGMGFATNSVGPTETLYVAGAQNQSDPPGAGGLAQIDPKTFGLTSVGDFFPTIDNAELTGTGDGRLFAFYTKNGFSQPSFIGEIQTTTGDIIGEKRFPTIDQGNAWAFAFWGGDFYMFHAPNNAGSIVTRYRPADESLAQVGSLDARIVGAGVSTCAPQE